MRDKNRLTKMIVPFYLGEQPDTEGRMIQKIWAWDYQELEIVHNYIQWLFPLPESSAFNPNAPVVDDEVIQCFQTNTQLRQNLLKSLILMLRFYGLQGSGDQNGNFIVTKSAEYPERQREWICIMNHNYLRITRILKCLIVMGLESYAQAFYHCLEQLYRQESRHIGSKTFQYWTNAVKMQ